MSGAQEAPLHHWRRVVPARLAISLPGVPRVSSGLVNRIVPVLELKGEEGQSAAASSSPIGAEALYDGAALRAAIARSLIHCLLIRGSTRDEVRSIIRSEDFKLPCERLARAVGVHVSSVLQCQLQVAESGVTCQASPLRYLFARKAGIVPLLQNTTSETVVAWNSGEVTFLYDKAGIEQEEFYKVLLLRSIAPSSLPHPSPSLSTLWGEALRLSTGPQRRATLDCWGLVLSGKLEGSALAAVQVGRMLSHTNTRPPLPSLSTSHFGAGAEPPAGIDLELIKGSSNPLSMWGSLASANCTGVLKCSWTPIAFGSVPSAGSRCGGAVTTSDIRELGLLRQYLISLLPRFIAAELFDEIQADDDEGDDGGGVAGVTEETIYCWVEAAKTASLIVNRIAVLLGEAAAAGTAAGDNDAAAAASFECAPIGSCLAALGTLRYVVGRSANYFDRRNVSLGAAVVHTLVRETSRFVRCGISLFVGGTATTKLDVKDWQRPAASDDAAIVCGVLLECLNKIVHVRVAEFQHATTAALISFAAEKARIMIDLHKHAQASSSQNSNGGARHEARFFDSGTETVKTGKRTGITMTTPVSSSLLWVYTQPILPHLLAGCQAVGLVHHEMPRFKQSQLFADCVGGGDPAETVTTPKKHLPLPIVVNRESDLLSQFGWAYLVTKVMETHSQSALYPGFADFLKQVLRLELYGDVNREEEGSHSPQPYSIDSISKAPSGAIVLDSSHLFPSRRKSNQFSAAELFYVAALGHRSHLQSNSSFHDTLQPSSSDVGNNEEVGVPPLGKKRSRKPSRREAATLSPISPQEEIAILKTFATSYHNSGSHHGTTTTSSGGTTASAILFNPYTSSVGALLSAVVATHRFICKEGRSMNHRELTEMLNHPQRN